MIVGETQGHTVKNGKAGREKKREMKTIKTKGHRWKWVMSAEESCRAVKIVYMAGVIGKNNKLSML